MTCPWKIDRPTHSIVNEDRVLSLTGDEGARLFLRRGGPIGQGVTTWAVAELNGVRVYVRENGVIEVTTEDRYP
jgi:hypothetical protein